MLLLLACSLTKPPPPGLGDYGPVPAFSLVNQAGAAFGPEQLRGKVWVADFFFTSCPDVCPILSAHMAEVQAHYEAQPDVHLVSFSVDPETDTPPVLATYATRFGARPDRWTFLTGPIDQVRAAVVDGFRQSLEAVPGTTEKPATILHGSRFIVVDRQGTVRGFPDPKEPGKVSMYAMVDWALAQ